MNTHTAPVAPITLPAYTIDPDDYIAAVAAITESRLMFAVAPIDFSDKHPLVGVIVMYSMIEYDLVLEALVYIDHEYVTAVTHRHTRTDLDVSATATELAHTIATALRSRGYAVEL